MLVEIEVDFSLIHHEANLNNITAQVQSCLYAVSIEYISNWIQHINDWYFSMITDGMTHPFAQLN